MKKGQYMIIEQVVIFALGLVIAMGFILIFSDFSLRVSETAQQRQVNIFSELIASHVLAIHNTGDTASLEFALPETVAGEEYRISLNQQNVTVMTIKSELRGIAPLSGLNETIDLSGTASSNAVRGKLTYNRTHIILSGIV